MQDNYRFCLNLDRRDEELKTFIGYLDSLPRKAKGKYIIEVLQDDVDRKIQADQYIASNNDIDNVMKVLQPDIRQKCYELIKLKLALSEIKEELPEALLKILGEDDTDTVEVKKEKIKPEKSEDDKLKEIAHKNKSYMSGMAAFMDAVEE